MARLADASASAGASLACLSRSGDDDWMERSRAWAVL